MRNKTTDKSLFAGSRSLPSDGQATCDGSNATLTAFVKEHLASRQAKSESTDLAPSVPSIATTKRTPVYGLHGYDSKKPPDALQAYVRAFTRSGELVLDPFVGSGMTAVACLLSGRKCIAIDASPLATFVTRSTCTPVDSDSLLVAAKTAITNAQSLVPGLYDTQCGQCGKKARTYATIYSQRYQCRRCLTVVSLFDAIKASKDSGSDEEFRAACPSCAAKGITEQISTRQDRYGYVPVALEYSCECRKDRGWREHNDASRKQRDIFRQVDVPLLDRVAATPPAHWYPTRPFMWQNSDSGSWGVLWRPYHGDIRRVDQFFTARNLTALAALLESINKLTDRCSRDALRFLFSAFVVSQSKLQRYHPGSTFPNMVAPGLLYVAPMVKEYNAFEWFQGKVEGATKAFDLLADISPADLCVSTQSACSLENIPSDSVDYILTDPPYSGKIQYGELNFIQEAWLGFEKNWAADEIIVSSARGRNEADWAGMMKLAMSECYRVLKPGRWLSLCYHDSSEGTWGLLQDLMAEVSFVAEDKKGAIHIDAKEKSLKQITSDKITKRDLVINFRKPKPGEFGSGRVVIPESADAKTFRELARQIIRECLTNNPGSTKDRIYDELVSRMVRAGTMQAHNFDELLREVADEARTAGGASRWYLKDAEEATADAAETAREDKAAAVLGKCISKKTDETGDEGVHYSDLFEAYLYAVKDKPRRSLADWLPDYYYKTEDGTWRLPASDEERELKEKARATGENRRIKRFANMLAAGVTIPRGKIPTPVTLAEWIRHAKRAGLFEAGKMLYERGGLDLSKLSEEQQVEVEEDYQTCVRALQRAAGGEVTGKKKRGKKGAK